MIQVSLQDFCNRMVAKGTITLTDVQDLARAVLPDGLVQREEADMLIGLDRALPGADPAFADFLVTGVVDLAVWGERPTGFVTAETARWLAATLSCGTGPTATGARIAVEVVREAQSCDPDLVAFALRINRLRDVFEEVPAAALAA